MAAEERSNDLLSQRSAFQEIIESGALFLLQALAIIFVITH